MEICTGWYRNTKSRGKYHKIFDVKPDGLIPCRTAMRQGAKTPCGRKVRLRDIRKHITLISVSFHSQPKIKDRCKFCANYREDE